MTQTALRKPQGITIIGIIGNLGTGKSTVRRMLERLGALGIDADGLVHRALLSNSPLYYDVVNRFGEGILNEDKTIDRARLASLVFQDKKSLYDLERLTHPAVERAVEALIHSARQPVIAIEAIKLLESRLAGLCDSIWLVDAPQETLIERIAHGRKMTRQQVVERLKHQVPANIKPRSADVVISNDHSIFRTWKQVRSNFLQTMHEHNSSTRRSGQPDLQPGSQLLTPGNFLLVKKYFQELTRNQAEQEFLKHDFFLPNRLEDIPSSHLGLQSRDFYMQILTDYQLLLRRSNQGTNGIYFSIHENFLLAPFIPLGENQKKGWLEVLLSEWQTIADNQLDEAVLLWLPQGAGREVELVCAYGYQILTKDSPLSGLWKSEIAGKEIQGYNVWVKNLSHAISLH